MIIVRYFLFKEDSPWPKKIISGHCTVGEEENRNHNGKTI